MTSTVVSPQNFSLPAGYNEVVTFDVNPVVTPSLVDATIWWRVYAQELGMRVGDPIISKSTEDSPPTIVASESPLQFTVQLLTADTLDLLGNYYHEATIRNAVDEVIGGSVGIMTVTETQNR